MNITNEITEVAFRLKLDWISTGGGCDFIFREFKHPSGMDKIQAILTDRYGGSPDTLDEPSEICVYFGEDWQPDEMFAFTVPSARIGLEVLAGMDSVGMAGIWSATEEGSL